MRTIALSLIVSLALSIGARPAEAGCGQRCPGWLDAIGLAFGVALVAGYSIGTGYFVYRDVTDDTQEMKYGGTELTYNLLFGSLFTMGVIHADSNKEVAVAGGLLLVHAALASHGAWRVYEHRREIHVELPDDTLAWTAGIAYGANEAVWALKLPERHGRTYGIVEASVHAPIVAGLGYLAVDRARDGRPRQAVLFGGLAALSGAFAYHGVHTALHPTKVPALDLGIDVAPTVVTDGRELAPGLGVAGAW
jgi:hypothetical protein